MSPQIPVFELGLYIWSSDRQGKTIFSWQADCRLQAVLVDCSAVMGWLLVLLFIEFLEEKVASNLVHLLLRG